MLGASNRLRPKVFNRALWTPIELLGPATKGRKGRGDRRQVGRAPSAFRSESEGGHRALAPPHLLFSC
jgi:hypothetical protein